jgi:hypothetical protein
MIRFDANLKNLFENASAVNLPKSMTHGNTRPVNPISPLPLRPDES